MDFLIASLHAAVAMLLALDPEVVHAVWASVFTSGVAIVLAAGMGIPAGVFLGLRRFAGRRAAVSRASPVSRKAVRSGRGGRGRRTDAARTKECAGGKGRPPETGACHEASSTRR